MAAFSSNSQIHRNTLKIFCLVVFLFAHYASAQSLLHDSNFITTENKKYEASIGTQYISYHESESRIYGQGNDKYPTLYSGLLRDSHGLKIPRGESMLIKPELSIKPRSFLFLRNSFIGRTNFNENKWAYNLPELYGDASWRGLIFSVGRKPLWWGQSQISPLLISHNARPLDLIALQTRPSRLPWIFDSFGLTQASLFIARTLEDRVPAHDYIFGWRVGVTPADIFSLNFSAIYETRGDGVHKGSASDLIIEVLGSRRNLGDGVDDASNVTARGVAVDFNVPFSLFDQSYDFYSEHHIRDCCGKIKNILTQYYSFSYGIRWASSKLTNAFQIDLEWQQLADKIYFHSTWPSQFSNGGRLMGAYAGRNGHNIYFRLTTPALKNIKLKTLLFLENNQSNENLDRNLRSIKEFLPSYESGETRLGNITEINYLLSTRWKLTGSGGLFRVWDKDYLTGHHTWEWGTSLGAQCSL